MTNPAAKTPSEIVITNNTMLFSIYFMEGFVMCMEGKKQCIPDSDLRDSLTTSILNLSKENQIEVLRKALELGFFKNKEES